MTQQTTPTDPAAWSLLAERCHIHAVGVVEDATRELLENLDPRQHELFTTVMQTQRQVEEIQDAVALEEVLAHLSDPARVVRALFDHLRSGGTGLPTCCGALPALPFEERFLDRDGAS